MSHFIKNTCESDRLVLTWQSPDLNGERKRFGVADLLRVGDDAVLEYRDDDDVRDARELGYAGYPAFRIRDKRHTEALAAFMRRMPPRGRSDFDRYLSLFRLSNDVVLSDFGLLGYTEAKLPSDGFALVDSLSNACVPSEHFMELAGFRHYPEGARRVNIGDKLDIEAEPTNKFDANAVAVKFEGFIVGYVNRFQVGAFHYWLQQRTLNAWLERRNGTLERPRAYMFVAVN